MNIGKGKEINTDLENSKLAKKYEWPQLSRSSRSTDKGLEGEFLKIYWYGGITKAMKTTVNNPYKAFKMKYIITLVAAQ